MSTQGKASPEQRVRMEQRWAKVRHDCDHRICVPNDAMHTKECTRKIRKAKIETTGTTVVRVEDVPVEENWNRFERGLFEDRFEAPSAKAWGVPVQEAAPARPWWKFWGRRG